MSDEREDNNKRLDEKLEKRLDEKLHNRLDESLNTNYATNDTEQPKKSRKPLFAGVVVVVLLLLGGVAYANWTDILAFVSPEAYMTQISANTGKQLMEEFKAVENNAVFKALGEITKKPSQHVVNLSPSLFVGYEDVIDPSGVSLVVKNDNEGNQLSAETILPLYGTIGAYLNDENVIVSALGMNVSLSASKPLTELVEFANLNGLQYAVLESLGYQGLELDENDMLIPPAEDVDISYRSLESEFEMLDVVSKNAVSDDPYVAELQNLGLDFYKKGTLEIKKKTVNVLGNDINARVTAVTFSEADFKEYANKIIDIMLENGGTFTLNTPEDKELYKQTIEQSLSIFKGAVTVNLVEIDNKYKVFQMETEKGLFYEVGMVGKDKMLDELYLNVYPNALDIEALAGEALPFDVVGLSASSKEVSSGHYTSELKLTAGLEKYTANFDWDTTKSADNMRFDVNNIGSFVMTFAVDGDSVVIKSGEVKVAGESLVEKDAMTYAASPLRDAVTVPTETTNIVDFNLMEIFGALYGFEE